MLIVQMCSGHGGGGRFKTTLVGNDRGLFKERPQKAIFNFFLDSRSIRWRRLLGHVGKGLLLFSQSSADL